MKIKCTMPARLLLLCSLAWLWFTLIYHLGAQWSVYEQYNYGWAVPFLCLYLLWGKAETLKTEMLKSSTHKAEVHGPRSVISSPVVSGPGFSFSAFQLFSFFLLSLLYLPTRFLHEANPIWRLTSLLWTLEVIGITLLAIRLVHGPWPAVRGVSSRLPFPLSAFSFSDFAFPICFFLVAVPWPSGLEDSLTQSLMHLNVTTTVELLGLFGIPAIPHSNVIEIASGMVGIDEACSGIRSLQATLMLSLFF